MIIHRTCPTCKGLTIVCRKGVWIECSRCQGTGDVIEEVPGKSS